MVFTEKAREEMKTDGLIDVDVYESIMNAKTVQTKRSRSAHRQRRREKICIVTASTYSGIRIYTKGVLRERTDRLEFYVLISSKRSTDTN